MIRDSQTGVWEAAALVATAVSTNAIDLGAPYVASTLQRDPSVGEPLVFILTVGVSATVELPRWAPEYIKLLAVLEERCGLKVDQEQVLKDILAETVIEIEVP